MGPLHTPGPHSVHRLPWQTGQWSPGRRKEEEEEAGEEGDAEEEEEEEVVVEEEEKGWRWRIWS